MTRGHSDTGDAARRIGLYVFAGWLAMRGRLAAWRYRFELYARRRWTDPELHEVELAVMGSAILLGILALLLVLGRLG